MDKVSNINFTGISNIAGVSFSRKGNSISRSLSMVLSNDFNGQDFTNFQNVLKKIPNKSDEFKNSVSPDILNIECVYEPLNNKNSALYVNGQKLDVNDDNLPMFSYIAKLSKRIVGMDDKSIIVYNDYKKYMADEAIIYGVSFKKNLPDSLNKEEIIDSVFLPKNSKSFAQYVNNFVQDLMNNYFGVK